MNRQTVQARRAALETSIEVMQNDLHALPVPQCLNCEHYNRQNMCDKFMAEPPEHILATGCPEWEYDHIPF